MTDLGSLKPDIDQLEKAPSGLSSLKCIST